MDEKGSSASVKKCLLYKTHSALETSYLGLVSSQHIDHDLHDGLVHAQDSHQVGMLVENFVVHYVTGMQRKGFCD